MKNLKSAEKADKLYRLISSLDKSEKGFIKKFASLHTGEDANSLRLFDIYNNLKSYDKNKIDKQIQKEKFASYLPKTKNYLCDLIMRALRAYNSSKDDWTIIRTMILDVDILQKKRLYPEAASLIRKIKKTALEREWYTTLIDASILEAKLVKVLDISSDEYAAKYMELNDEVKRYRKMEEAQVYFKDVMNEVYIIVCEMAKFPKKTQAEKALALISDHKFEEFEIYKGCKIDIYRSFTLCMYYFLSEQNEAFLLEAKQLMAALKNPFARYSIGTFMINVYFYNLGEMAVFMKNYTTFELCRLEMKALIKDLPATENTSVHCTNRLFNMECDLHMITLNFEKGLQAIADNQQLVHREDDIIDGNFSTPYFYHSYFLFLAGRYEECIQKLNAIELFSEKQSVIYDEHKMLKILCHLSQNNVESAFYLARTHLYYLKQNKLYFPQRKLFLSLLIKNFSTKRDFAKSFLKEAENNQIGPDESIELFLFDLRIWAEALAKGLPMQEFIKEGNMTAAKKEKLAELY